MLHISKRIMSSVMRVAAFAAILCLTTATFAGPQQFTYQALIANNAGQPATSTNVTVKLDLYSAASGGTLLGTQTFTALNLSTSAGYVSLPVNAAGLDLSGDVFVELTVTDVAAAGSPETLAPRQKLTSAPFALQANTLAASFGWPNRTLFVNPSTVPSSASPTGSIADPFNSISAAYAKAKTMSPSYVNRVVVMLMPGNHVLSSPVVLDTQGVDVIGFGERSAVVTGTASPLFSATASGGTGATIRNMIMQVPTGSGNRALSIVDGRVQDVVLSQAGGAVAPNLLLIAASSGVSFKDVEVIGDVAITSYGAQTTFNGGYISGAVTSTGASASATSMLAFSNMSGIGGVSFNPAGAYGAIGFSNAAGVTAISYAANTVIRAQSTVFANTAGVPLALPNPLTGSFLANCMGNATSWTGSPLVASPGNVAGVFSAFLSK